ncbi:MAG: tetratricopeptide repeat protein [Acidobacteria bacterium]|nr:tetratricopeptide repeat protein [Acidobacteriota bacterium]
MRRALQALGGFILLLIAAVPAAAQLPAGSSVVVLPFENPNGVLRVEWLREGLAVLVGDALDAGGMHVVSRDERLLTFDRLQVPEDATISRASAIKVGQTLGVAAVVVGRIEAVNDEIVLAARLIGLDNGRLSSEVTERGPVSGLFAMTARLAAGVSGLPELASRWTPPPQPAAFEMFVKGLLADQPQTSRSLFEQTLKTTPDYDAARLALWDAQTELGSHQRALDAVTPVAAGRTAYRDARFRAALSLMSLKRDDEAFDVLSGLQSQQTQAAVANALGVLQLRRGGGNEQAGRATYFFNQATELEPAESDYFFNLGYAYWLDKDANGAAYWLREAVRRDPADGDAHFVLGAALQQMGAPLEAARERELATRLSARYAAATAKAGGGTDTIPRGLERLHVRLDAVRPRVDAAVMTSGQRDQAALATFHLDAARRAYDRESDAEAEQELRRALFLSPYLADAQVLLGRVYVRRGRSEDAVQAFKIAVWSEERVDTLLALAEALLAAGDAAAARPFVDRALVLEPKSAAALALKTRLGPGD